MARHNADVTELAARFEKASEPERTFYTQNGWAGENYGKAELKEVSKLTREYVKAKYPTCKFNVRKSNHKSLDVDLIEHSMRRDSAAYKAMLDDVNAFVNSYNYSDCDGMIDYFDVFFWYSGVNDHNANYVPKEEKEMKATATRKTAKKASTKATRKKADEPRYTIRQDVHTKTNEPLWVVRCNVTLSREDYFKESDFMRSIGGYYSRYKHGFIFKADPTEKLA